MYSDASAPAVLELNTLLASVDIAPAEVIVVRHRPREPGFHRALPWLVADRPDLFELYQSIQADLATRTIRRATYLASFVGLNPGTATFAGLFKVRGAAPISEMEFLALSGAQELMAYQLQGFAGDSNLRLDLEPLGVWADWVGRLVIDWTPPERSWIRRAERNQLAVRAITLESEFAKAMPSWDDIVLDWNDLAVLPKHWRHTFAEWRGIYFIFDTARGKGYVGSAYGDDNILGRWAAYARSGHGGNVRLRESRPQDLRFSILQLMAPAALSGEVQAAEASWKRRLQTREFGLNAN
jgi:hypothetical protein